MTIKNLLLGISLLSLSSVSFAGNVDDLTAACMKGDLTAAQKAIEAGADVNGKDAVGWTPLGAAIFYPQITQLLLDKKADPNLGDSPALVNAAAVGSFEVMQLLLKAGADANKPLVIDPSANIQKAIDERKAKKDFKPGEEKVNKIIIKTLEEQLAKVKGNPMKLYAIQRSVQSTLCKECIELLIEKGAKTNVENAVTKGNLLDEFASSALSPEGWIINNKAQVGGWEKMGFVTPEWYKNPDVNKLGTPDAIVKVLVKAGVDINAENVIKDSPLVTSVRMGTSNAKSEVVKAFVNNGANINAEGNGSFGHVLLQTAGKGYIDAMEAMFAKGADMNREFKVDDKETGQRLKGINPLMWAARNGHLEAVKYLVGKGAKLDEGAFGASFNFKTKCMTSVKKKTAIFYAIESENLEVVKYLVESTKGDWTEKMIIDPWKRTSDMGFQTVTTCIDDKAYSPSAYAKACGLTEIADYLKSKKI